MERLGISVDIFLSNYEIPTIEHSFHNKIKFVDFMFNFLYYELKINKNDFQLLKITY